MKVLVTGASGFIGGYIVQELLEHGYQVKGLTRKNNLNINGAEIFKGDITKPDSLIQAIKSVDAVFHNAAYAMDWGKKSSFVKTNIEGTRNVAEACIKENVDRIIYTSSAGVYGFPNNNKQIVEESIKKPFNTYQKTKLEGEKVLKKYKEIKVSTIRPPLVFGAGSPGAKILLSTLKKGKFMYIGDGEQKVSIAHPKDVARCLRLILEFDDKGEAYNIVSFICKIKDLFKKIAEKSGIKEPEKHIPFWVAYMFAIFNENLKKKPTLTRFRVKSLGTNREISCQKAKSKLGYEPIHNLNSTVEEIIDWYNKKS